MLSNCVRFPNICQIIPPSGNTLIFLHSCSCSIHSITSRSSACAQAITTGSRYFTKCCCQQIRARFPGGCFCHESRSRSKGEKRKTAHDYILSEISWIRLVINYAMAGDFSGLIMKICTCSTMFSLTVQHL